jgi:lipopolysaccharide transport system ATP-binding protein
MAKEIVIIENLSKQYVIDHAIQTKDSFRDMIARKAKAILKGNSTTTQREVYHALKNINLRILEGERLGIIGKNGAGKSTLLKILSRVTLPTSGKIRLMGRTGSLLEVGTGFHGDLTGRENIYLNGSIMGMKRSEITRKFDEIVSFAEISRFLDTPVKWYSSGMYMRLAFSIAAHLEPEILIIDEVLAVGDQNFQKKCLGKMELITKNEGRTILFVSHNLEAVNRLCNVAILLDEGRISFEGSPSACIAHYLSEGAEQTVQSFAPKETVPSITFAQIDTEKLKAGSFRLCIRYESPYDLIDPVPGFVIYNIYNNPVLGSNPRYHSGSFASTSNRRGEFVAEIPALELHSGTYKVSLWLGDHYQDYDEKTEALSFQYENTNNYILRPDTRYIGSVDKPCQWSLKAL